MKIVRKTGRDDIATVYAATFRNDERYVLEFVDSLSGGRSVEEKWVVVVSSQFGCPVGCSMCDTRGYFMGNPDTGELLEQVDYVVRSRFPGGRIPSRKFKVQFARMGEPSLNPNVPEALLKIRSRYDAPGYMPCLSTVAPTGRDEFFDEIDRLNRDHFRGRFQLQFSIHSTRESQRDRIIPLGKWSLSEIADYGEKFYRGGRKITLNFAMGPDNELSPGRIDDLFDPDKFMIKVTPVNPSEMARASGMVREDLKRSELPQLRELDEMGYDTVLSIGDLRENEIGSNCGQLAALWNRGATG